MKPHIDQLWSDLASTDAEGKTEVLGHLYQGLKQVDDPGRFEVGQQCVELLVAEESWEEAFDLGHDLSSDLIESARTEDARILIESLLHNELFVPRNFVGLLRWNYADIFRREDNFSIAAIEFRHAFETFREDDRFPRACLAQYEGEALRKLGHFHDALQRLCLAVDLFESEGFMEGVAVCKRHVAGLLIQMCKPSMAIAYATEAKLLYEFMRKPSECQKTDVVLGQAQSDAGELELARETLTKASGLRSNDVQNRVAVEALFYLAEVTLRSGDVTQAGNEFREVAPLLRATNQVDLEELALTFASEGQD